MRLCGQACLMLLLPLPWEEHGPGNPLVPGEWKIQRPDLKQIHGQELIIALYQVNSRQTTGTGVQNQSLICMPLLLTVVCYSLILPRVDEYRTNN